MKSHTRLSSPYCFIRGGEEKEGGGKRGESKDIFK